MEKNEKLVINALFSLLPSQKDFFKTIILYHLDRLPTNLQPPGNAYGYLYISK